MDEHPDQVVAVVADGHRWSRRGITIAMVEPTEDGGVRIGVRGDPCLAQAEMRKRYRFPVTCYRWIDRPVRSPVITRHPSALPGPQMSTAADGSRTGMDITNLAKLYGAPPMEWDDVRTRLGAGFEQGPETNGPGRHTCWLTSVNADGSPHVNALGAIWSDGSFWFVTGRSTRRGRNITRDPRCALALSLREFDLVVEGRAVTVTDPDDVARLARRWAEDEGWPCKVDESGVALTAPYSAQSAGRPPWHVYRLDARSAHAVQTVEPYGAARWRF